MAKCRHCDGLEIGNYISHIWKSHPEIAKSELRPVEIESNMDTPSKIEAVLIAGQ